MVAVGLAVACNAFHGVSIGLAIVIVLVIFFNFGGGIFAWHMAAMVLAWLVLATQGVFAYKDVGISACATRHARRKRHRSFMASGGMLALFGLLFIISDKKKQDVALLPSTVHGWIGSVTMLLALQQVIVGVIKFAQLKYKLAPMPLHGLLGKLTLPLAYIAIITGMLHVHDLSHWPGPRVRKTEGLASVLMILLVAMVGVQGLVLLAFLILMPTPPDSSDEETLRLNDPPIDYTPGYGSGTPHGGEYKRELSGGVS